MHGKHTKGTTPARTFCCGYAHRPAREGAPDAAAVAGQQGLQPTKEVGCDALLAAVCCSQHQSALRGLVAAAAAAQVCSSPISGSLLRATQGAACLCYSCCCCCKGVGWQAILHSTPQAAAAAAHEREATSVWCGAVQPECICLWV